MADGWTTATLAILEKETMEELEKWNSSSRSPAGRARHRQRWPCRLSRLVGRAGDNLDLRDRAERLERTRWKVMLKTIIVESELPAAVGGMLIRMEWRGRGRRPSSNSSSNYLTHRVAEPCGKSIPISLMKTLMFIEVAKKHPALKNALEKVILELGSLDLRWRQAAQIPVEIVMAMERHVMTEGAMKPLRFSGTQGMLFGKIEMSGRGLRGVLERTKTT
ncbi:unnamed protein product [Effrenium voratum]|uniref:Uncharacterized protein n=1 Tax=Effrenium voratum TaxID=2562239 RepID=A0AA36ILS8_9DINO|nr:unnamed protein product [Effrenium voratum]